VPQDPARGALVNVVGTANVFEAVKAHRDRVSVSSISPRGGVRAARALRSRPVTDDSPPRPATHYGVYKVANEETARIYWEEHKIPSMGFRPLSVYGPGRDFGLTADPTLAMKAAVLGRPYQIRWGGATDLIYAEDVAQACIAASTSTLDRARVYNLHGESAKIAEVVRMIEDAWPAAKGKLSHVEQPIPFPGALDDPGYQRDLGPRPRTGLRDGIRKTLDEFAALQKAGRLDARELDPPGHERDRPSVPPPPRMRRRSVSSTTRASRIASPPWKPSSAPPRSAASGWPPRAEASV
jgi:nucleoside-diphosphate-sugar epimerase